MAATSFLPHFCHGAAQARLFGDRGLALLGVLLQTYKAGVHALVHYGERGVELGRVLDSLGDGILVADPGGKVLHENVALERILAGEPEAARIRVALGSAAVRIARLLGTRARREEPAAAPPLHLDIRTARRRYVIVVSLLRKALLGRPAVLVSLQPVAPKPLSDAVLGERYRLTPREIEVARHLACGLTDRQVGSRLGISVCTARHHAENIYRKLDVNSRRALTTKLVDA